jgi:hypothetical protein
MSITTTLDPYFGSQLGLTTFIHYLYVFIGEDYKTTDYKSPIHIQNPPLLLLGRGDSPITPISLPYPCRDREGARDCGILAFISKIPHYLI